ncbi:unnamed protein product, partial [Adineta steineri]
MFPKKKSSMTTRSNKEQRLKTSGQTGAIASFAQQRIYLHEQLYYGTSDISVYNILVPLIIKSGSVPIERVHSSLLSVIQQHMILRTAVRFNQVSNQIEQYIQPLTKDIYSFQHSRNISTSEQLDHLLTDETIKKYFDIENGKVVRCHIVQRSDDKDDFSLHDDDLIVLTFHHIAFDLNSFKPFMKAFEHACWTDEHQQPVLSILQYIDFALYEKTMLVDTNINSAMNKARRFWSNLMYEYDWNRIRHLIHDEGRTDQIRSGRGFTTTFVVDQHIIDAMMSYVSSNNITMYSLSLACYYVFLYKLTNNENDLCVAGLVDNRSEAEMKDMIGMFVNIVPYRIKMEPENSFYHLTQKVQQLNTSILEHARLPYQEIVNSHGERIQHVLPSTLFRYESLVASPTAKSNVEIIVDETTIIGIYNDRDRTHGNGISLFELTLTISHDHHTRNTECFVDCSVDIFKTQANVNLVGNCFRHILTQLFCSSMINEPISKLSIVPLSKQESMHLLVDTERLSSDSRSCSVHEHSLIEHEMSITAASMFWLDYLHDCNLGLPISLPYDRNHFLNKHLTDNQTYVTFDFGQDLSNYFLTYISSNNIKLQHMILATYYMFLFKLTNEERDICIAINISNQPKDKLQSSIESSENIIPFRCQLNPYWSFHQLLEYIRETTAKCMKYSYFPLQRILAQHSNVSKHAFLDTSFEFYTTENKINIDEVKVGSSQLCVMPISNKTSEDEILTNFNFRTIIYHNLNINQLSCTINASLDLFNVETIDNISQRFHSILKQFFMSVDDQVNKSIYEISLTLPNERLLMQSMNNTQVSFPSVTCIHHEFVYQVMKHPQKLAVELDEQSLTYAELLCYVQVLSLHLINKYHVVPGEIICQCVERSLSMVIGILSIAMVGSAYCPLSVRDPPQRLQVLVNQTQSRLVLVHASTAAIFSPDKLTLNIDCVIRLEERFSEFNLNELSNVPVTPESVVFIIFTSGSTGIPKAVQLRHRNFTEFMHSFVHIDVVRKSDTIIQMARCSFDNHLLSLVGTLIIGSTLVMLRPEGNMDLEYLTRVLDQKQITVMHAVPSLLNSLFEFLRLSKRTSPVKYLRSLCSGGEAINVKQVTLFQNLVGEQCQIRNHYGPAEITINCACYLIDQNKSQTSISIGQILPNYQCLILDEFLQLVCTGQEGELLVRGVGIFAGYFNRDDFTAKAMISINGEMYHKTGDLVRMDNEGFLYYVHRQDYQVKLHGQRIELGEIERCLLNITSISACVVMKWNDDYLVAYVQSSHANEEQLRQHCQSHLPPHMIPSIFIILEKLPLNPNGKIDRKLLPSPTFSSIQLTNNIDLLTPSNEIEVNLHRIWCDILKQNQISINTNIFTIGGHSLLIMQLFHQYKVEFHLETNTLSISSLFQHPTIIDHAKLIQQSVNTNHTLVEYPWSSLHIVLARASFAQERIYLDEQIRFSSNKTTMNNMYVIPLLYRISSMNDNISITRLRHAFQSIITKHNILRTALYIDDTNSHIIQHCLDAKIILNDNMKPDRFTIVNIHNDDHRHVNDTIIEILNQSDLFDLSKGRVIRCHILRHYHQSQDNISCENDDLLSENDHLL